MKTKLLIASVIVSGLFYTSCSSGGEKKAEDNSEETTELTENMESDHDHDHAS